MFVNSLDQGVDSEFIQKQKSLAQQFKRKIVFPEGDDVSIIQVANVLMNKGFASEVVLLGVEEKIKELADQNNIDTNLFRLIDPKKSELRTSFALDYYDLRKDKGIRKEEAEKEVLDPLKFSALFLRHGYVNVMVAGIQRTTHDVLLAGVHILGIMPGVSSASSCMIMDFLDKRWGSNGNMIFADCAIIPDPSAEELAEIAILTCESCKRFLDVEPLCALLSFSTKGSASHPHVDKVRDALAIVKKRKPDLKIDGELQLDAAIVPEVAKKKVSQSSVAGRANILIFPDLQSANIGYKLAQRFGNASAYGPFLQGFAQPLSDLSRGATVIDILNTCVILLAQV